MQVFPTVPSPTKATFTALVIFPEMKNLRQLEQEANVRENVMHEAKRNKDWPQVMRVFMCVSIRSLTESAITWVSFPRSFCAVGR
jgi:hypothetical protein